MNGNNNDDSDDNSTVEQDPPIAVTKVMYRAVDKVCEIDNSDISLLQNTKIHPLFVTTVTTIKPTSKATLTLSIN